jgi:hypothetical protein
MFDNSSVSGGNGTELCRYPDYNHPPWDEERRYRHTEVFFHIMFAKEREAVSR